MKAKARPEDKALALLAGMPEGASHKEWQATAIAAGIKRPTFYRHMAALVEAGRVVQDEDGRFRVEAVAPSAVTSQPRAPVLVVQQIEPEAAPVDFSAPLTEGQEEVIVEILLACDKGSDVDDLINRCGRKDTEAVIRRRDLVECEAGRYYPTDAAISNQAF